jgi:HD-GYP domain-containing protein (c-di-GMP phosphodiesterase class II)
MFGKNYSNLVRGYAKAFEFSGDRNSLLSNVTQKRIGKSLNENPGLIALSVRPLKGESLSAFRSSVLKESEVEKISNSVLKFIGNKDIAIGAPQVTSTTGVLVMAVAAPIKIEEKLVAAIVAVVSLEEVAQLTTDENISETEMWDLGLPIVFVVDKDGVAVSHPNPSLVSSQKSLLDLKIVEEWTSTNEQIQSALLPFETEYKGIRHEMIGAYSTANLAGGNKFGVIVMQDSDKALASVGEMKSQVWFISVAFAILATIIGLLLTRTLTSPLSALVAAAEGIASGNLTHRIEDKRITELSKLGNTFNTMSDELEHYIADLARAAEENRELFVGTVKALAAAIDGKDRYTRGHSERVSRVSLAIGQRLGMNKEDLEKLRISALLHDIGKIGIDDSILKKPAALTDEEYEIMKTHPQQGYKIMKNIPAMEEFLPGMYMHHEMVNGKGYPQGLHDEDIPLQAKIVAVADTFDAMTIDRPYSKGMNLEDSLERIKTFVGTRYDLRVVDALIRACADGQIGIGRVKLNKFKKPEGA